MVENRYQNKNPDKNVDKIKNMNMDWIVRRV